MLRRQWRKVFTLLCLLIVTTLWLVPCDTFFNVHNHFLRNTIRLRWRLVGDLSSPRLDDLQDFPLPDFKEEAAICGNRSNSEWFKWRGHVRPTESTRSSAHLFPDPRRPYDDRIPEQLMYLPPGYRPQAEPKTVLLYDYIGAWVPHQEGASAFQGCPVDRCLLTTDKANFSKAHAVLFDNNFLLPLQPKAQGQVWIIYMLESPLHTPEFRPADVFNWTMTYRPDSDIAIPYGRWVYHGAQHRRPSPLTNFAANKTRKVAWFVSNCHAKNLRNEYARELQKYIQVDIFGSCGDIECPRDSADRCYKLLAKDYKFYLAFENSNCKYYITEKFFTNSLRHNVIPVVMGARRGDYQHLGPAGSSVHVEDFASPQHLAAYLHRLDQDDALYNQYFLWRGTGQFIDHHFLCRLCTLLHSDNPPKYYKDINSWWRGGKACSTNY